MQWCQSKTDHPCYKNRRDVCDIVTGSSQALHSGKTYRFGLVDGDLFNLGLEMRTPRWIYDRQTRKSDGRRRQDKVNAGRWYLQRPSHSLGCYHARNYRYLLPVCVCVCVSVCRKKTKVQVVNLAYCSAVHGCYCRDLLTLTHSLTTNLQSLMSNTRSR